jgi:hypothetical protein
LKFYFTGLGFDHSAIYIRLNAFSSCDGTVKDQILQIFIDGVAVKTQAVGSTI